ncbi:hypothetical protein [Flavobacterium sp.]|uniref:hypothetical protein n=1 Tax=Flavobacterium sp. TaxID=239 RepID=UPI00286AC3AC|nr:hypothetical protein [Flavobacterium sp.]
MKSTVKTPKNKATENPDKAFPGNVNYPPSEDIYNQDKEETEINPEDISKVKSSNTADGKRNEKNFTEDHSGDDLDVPGSELDDDQENIGSEDEENNGYSIGSDDHNDLEEDNG